MLSFAQFIFEGKEEDNKNKKMWSEITPIDKRLPEPHKTAVDDWVGANHEGHGNSLMIPDKMESSYKEIHAQNKKLRDVISSHHGTHITAYRGTDPERGQSYGRKNHVSSWSTNKKAALYFGGGDVAKRTIKVYSPKEISSYNDILNKKGKITVGRHTYVKNEEDTVDKYDNQGEHIGEADSLHDHFHSHNEGAKEHNQELASNRREASKNIIKRKIPVSDIVHATNRTGQEELIVKN